MALFNVLDGLIEAWCERRALKPLRYILQGYPLTSGLTDDWHQLKEALENVRACCGDDLTPEEAHKLGRAIVEIQNRLEYR
ncbi:MAG: hypothetical protein LC800_02315 [Acidobacteria bacterium]|nr:hypothetical protein [Acidobacteriota bacterium]